MGGEDSAILSEEGHFAVITERPIYDGHRKLLPSPAQEVEAASERPTPCRVERSLAGSFHRRRRVTILRRTCLQRSRSSWG